MTSLPIRALLLARSVWQEGSLQSSLDDPVRIWVLACRAAASTVTELQALDIRPFPLYSYRLLDGYERQSAEQMLGAARAMPPCGLVFSSPNAAAAVLRLVGPARAKELASQAKLFALGAGTAQAIQQSLLSMGPMPEGGGPVGGDIVFPEGPGGAEALVAMVKPHLERLPSGDLLVVCARHARADLPEMLQALAPAHVRVRACPVFERERVIDTYLPPRRDLFGVLACSSSEVALLCTRFERAQHWPSHWFTHHPAIAETIRHSLAQAGKTAAAPLGGTEPPRSIDSAEVVLINDLSPRTLVQALRGLANSV